MAGPLEGIKVVELAVMIAVPGATEILAQQGADVVKVESTTRGDELRFYGSSKGGMSGWFANANANKRSLAVDLGTDDGRDVMLRLLDGADVFIQGFRPGAVDRLGLGADTALERNPTLIYVSSAGFGSTGPYADRPVYDPIVQALSGWAAAQADSEGNPQLIRGMAADKVASLTVAQAVSAALVSRATTGKGQHIEVSMLEANLAFMWPDVAMHCTLLDEDATHLPNLLQYYQLFQCADGWVSVTAGNDQQWRATCEALDRPELADHPQLATAAARSANFQFWYETFEDIVRPFTREDCISRLVAADVPAAPVLAPPEIAEDPQVVARGAVRTETHPVAGQMRVPGPAATFSEDGRPEWTPAPLHGEQTDAILAELGYDPAAIDALRAAGVCGLSPAR